MKLFSFFLLCTCVLLALGAKAQQAEKFDPVADNKDIRGCSIHLTPAPGGGFGFIVMKEKTTLWSQPANPFLPGHQKGFAHKADAYKLAEWVVSEREKDSRASIYMPATLARQLNISERQPQ